MSELRALVNLLEAIVEARRPADKVGNLVYLAWRVAGKPNSHPGQFLP
jgi:hypothetical protein